VEIIANPVGPRSLRAEEPPHNVVLFVEIKEARIYADGIGISGAVRFLGWLAEEQVSKIYDDARVFCLPSYNEGMPMVVLEAMGHGLPLVCTSVGGLPELVEVGVNGLMIAPGDLPALADSLSRLPQG
jgi:polysaccharide biosynthesis protein VpsI